ncbi:hypothetical protein DUI87_24855 [Hirundo rustica rustica]|uniref:Uncharacterized protein n=1 Tax=Hirundo rustica rustica TaxID=333673 RepID=A0A3M0JCR0_HIRRU|nr:hypothetical protein DUI87_24855 [Hirundo rustica rustica]
MDEEDSKAGMWQIDAEIQLLKSSIIHLSFNPAVKWLKGIWFFGNRRTQGSVWWDGTPKDGGSNGDWKPRVSFAKLQFTPRSGTCRLEPGASKIPEMEDYVTQMPTLDGDS